MKATWICVTLLLGQLYLVSAVHNITEALEALAPVPIEDLQTKTSLMEETDTSFSVTNIARKVENEYWLMSLFVVLGYLLQWQGFFRAFLRQNSILNQVLKLNHLIKSFSAVKMKLFELMTWKK